ncbi:MAG TPA: response regulator [Anaerolineales bacterium]|nr:response regulator [Anaerolineales bacterium]
MSSARHVIVIDDDPSIRRLIELILRHEGYRLSLLGSPVDILERARVDRPDLIITDLMMPQLNGLQLLHALKAEPDLAEIPVILITGAGQQSQVDLALALGAATCLYKPFSQARFIAAVRAALAGDAPASDHGRRV